LVGCFALKIVEDGLRVVAARLWLNVDVDDAVLMAVLNMAFDSLLVVKKSRHYLSRIFSHMFAAGSV
jgi:hypothetical protein